MPTFVPPTALLNPPVLPETRGVQRRLFRYFGPWPVGLSVVGRYITSNLLTAAQASFESAVPPHTLTNVVNPPVRTTAQAAHGSYSLAVTAIATASAAVRYPAIAILPSTTYYLMVSTRSAAATRNCGLWFDTRNSGGGLVIQGSMSYPSPSGVWTDSAYALTTTANCATLELSLSVNNPVAGETFYFDKVGLFRGSSATWVLPGAGSSYATVQNPDQSTLAGLVDGVDYFLGGHVYTVTDEVAVALTGAGYVVV